MGKTILIGLPKSFSFHENLEKNLVALGFDVINISYVDHDFKYPSFFHRFHNFIRKTLFNDKGYKNVLKFRKYEKGINAKLDKIDKKIDYALLIRPDIYPIKTLKKIKSKTNLMVGYQWDGLHRFPAVYATIKYFDRFFVFDDKDLAYSEKLLPLTNFYFDFDEKTPQSSYKYDVFFVGSFIRKRMQQISNLANFLVGKKYIPKIMIYCEPPSFSEKFPNQNIEYIFEHLSYERNIATLKNSRIVMDFLNQSHKGLSFRTFEALFYDKKLVTTNDEIKKYDFYNPQNIFVWDPDSTLGDLEVFLNTPYVEIDKKIKQKYSFTNWLHYVLDIQPYEKITLPKNIMNDNS